MTGRRDFFDRARLVAGALILVGALSSIVGPLLSWVSVGKSPAFSGLEAGSGWVALVAGVAMFANGVLLTLLKRSAFAWLVLLAAIVSGGVTMSDYRGLPDINPALLIGRPQPGTGMVLCAAGALLALIGAAAGIAASPRSPST